MAGYILSGGTEESVWNFIETHSMKKQELARSGAFLSIKQSEGAKNYRVEDLAPLYEFDSEVTRDQKYCVIEHAEGLTEIIQNKLLKLLEDSSIIFFLVASSADVFIDTVRSRLIEIHLGNEGNAEERRVLTVFRGLQRREDLFFRLHLAQDKDEQNAYYSMNTGLFFREVERLFLELLGQLSGGSSSRIPELGRLWSTLDEVMEVCGVCEAYASMKHVTKDDLFVFVAKIVEGGR